jgi:peroxiredoxin Q/BCP
VKSKISRYFGVKRIGPLGIKRQTFVIDVDRKILGVIASETNMKIHADRALQILQTKN